MDRRVAGWPSASRWKRRLVRKASPSPANIRAGSSPSRLKGNTPAVKGKWPGRCSERSQRTSSPWSVTRGRATRGMRVPDREVRHSAGTPSAWSPRAPSGSPEASSSTVRVGRSASHSSSSRRPSGSRPASIRVGSSARSPVSTPCWRPRSTDGGHLLGPAGLRGQPCRWWRGSRGRSRRSRPGSAAGGRARWPWRGWTGGPATGEHARGGHQALGRPAGPSAGGKGRSRRRR